MISAPDTTDRQTWRALIQALADEAKTRTPDAASRIDKAVVLALMNDVEMLDDGNALVGSQARGDRVYTVYGGRRCECPDGFRSSRCKHVLAVALMQQALAQMPAPTPLSLSFTVLVDNVELDLTLRGTNAEDILDQLQRLLQRQTVRPLATLDPRAA
jgi:hypothetical protein